MYHSECFFTPFTDTIVVEIVSNVSDAAIMRKVFDAIGVIVKETLLEQKNIKNNVR